MAHNFKNARRVIDSKLLEDRMGLLGARRIYPHGPHGIHARPAPTPEERAYQHQQLLKQREDFAGATLYRPSTKGGAGNHRLPNMPNVNMLNVNEGESDTTEIMNPDELPHPNDMEGEIELAMGNSIPAPAAPAAPQGGRRRRRTARKSGGKHRRGHKGRRASQRKRRHLSQRKRR